MKKFISVMMLLAVLVSLCACTKNEQQAEQNAATPEPGSPEALYGDIDQTQKIDGVYKIWSPEGVKHMLENPGESFELLCDVDMKGAAIAPIREFTGTINGAAHYIKNFTVQGGDETDFGFIGVNKGQLSNLYLKNVTLIPGPNAKNIGGFVGNNQATVTRCVMTNSKLDVPAAPAGANVGGLAGLNTGNLTNTQVGVDLNVQATGEAYVGGIVGTTRGGTVEYIETEGKLDITGGKVSAGLFAGTTDSVLEECVFLGESNTLDGKLFEAFTGNEDDELVMVTNARYRDNDHHAPLTEGQEKLRQRVVDEMNAMGTIEWQLHNDLPHTCVCSLDACNGTYNNTAIYRGLPYNHKGGSLARMKYILDEDGYVKDWVYELDSYDGFDLYIGNDCSTALAHAWWTVSNSTDFMRCTYELPQMTTYPNVATGMQDSGVLKVGEYNSDFELNSKRWTIQFIEENDEQTIYEAYACLRKGDAYVYMVEAGGHTRMAVADAVVVRDQQGLIDPKYSYVLSTEQGYSNRIQADAEGNTTGKEIISNWRVNYKYTFANLYFDTAIPVTCEELVTGEMEPSTCEMQGAVEGYAGMYNGTVKANYFLDSVDLEVKNSKGETVFFHTLWTTADKRSELGENDGGLRNYKDDFDMVGFGMALSKFQFEIGETYSYTVTAHLHTYEDYVVHESSFTYGQA